MPLTSVLLPPTRLRHTGAKAAPLTHAQRKERTERNRLRQQDINSAVEDWKQSTMSTVTELARRFDKKERYFLDMFFEGGAHLIHKHQKVNVHNAFLSAKAEELRDSTRFNLFYAHLY